MKKLLVMAAVMLASVGAYAQHAVGSFTLQPKVGMNIANLTDADDADARIGFVGGLETEYQATDIFSLSAGVLYSMQGCKYDNDKVKTTSKLDYINIPIMANVYVAKGLAVKLGVQPAFNVNSEVKVSGGKYSTSADVDAKSFDFSIPVGISYEYSNVVLDARYNWGLTKVADGSDSKNSVFQITLGYKFDL
ncbi:MAG: porin family protein [Prevotella sp.]|nr:porin family protein [Prevotella sp.]MDY6270297.1 porin family protein [Prevotella sp.]